MPTIFTCHRIRLIGDWSYSIGGGAVKILGWATYFFGGWGGASEKWDLEGFFVFALENQGRSCIFSATLWGWVTQK